MVMLLLLLAATVWVGSSLNLVQEMWAAALNAVFTSLSTMIAVAQWRMQTPPERAHTAPDVHHPFVRTMTSTRKGAVIVYTPRTWRGTALRLVAGLHETTAPCVPIEAVSIVVEDRSRERRMFVCCFPMVPPGHYTLAAPVKQRTTHITVRRSHCAEVDWR